MRWIETATLRLLVKILNDSALYGPYLKSLATEANKATAAAVAERSRLKRQLLEAQEDLDGTFDKSRMAGYSQKSIERIRRVKEADVERIEDALARIVSPRAAIDVERRIEELGGLAAALREISTADAIDTMTEEGAKLAAAIRALISRLVPTPDPASHGVSVTLTLAEMAFYDAGAVTCEGPVRVVRGTYVPPTKEEQRLAKGQAEVEEHLSTGNCILDENAWCSIRQNLPEGITSRLDGELRDGRALVDATILALRLRRPFADLPMAYGSRKPLRNAIKALVSSGAWFQIATTLKKLAPHMLEGVDAERFDYFLKTYKRISGGAPARRRRDIIIQLLRRTEGATLDEIRAATGQTAGVVRSAVCRLKRLDLQVVRFKRADETRAWRLTTV